MGSLDTAALRFFRKMSIQDARIIETDDSAGYTAYIINITSTDGQYQVKTRYSEVELLVATLKQAKIDVPKLPRKHLFGSKGSKVVEERKQAINAIMEVLVEKHLDNADVSKFLDPAKDAPAAERLSRVDDIQADKVSDAFAGDLFEHTWPEAGPLGLSLTSHLLGDGTVIAVVHESEEGNPKELVGTVVETVNGVHVPTDSQAEILAAIRSSPRPVTIGFRKSTGEEMSAPISWEETKEAAAGEAPAEPRARADTGTMDPERLSSVLATMHVNENGLIDEKEFQETLNTDGGGLKPQLLHYLKFKRWLKAEYSEVVKKEPAKLEDCLDSEMLLAYMAEMEIPTDSIPEECYVLQRVDQL